MNRRAQENVEKAKVHIRKFKSIASSRENWTLTEIDVVSRLESSLATARSQGVAVETYFPEDECPLVHADPDSVDEIFDEFVANSLNWLENTEEPRITMTKRPKAALSQLALLKSHRAESSGLARTKGATLANSTRPGRRPL